MERRRFLVGLGGLTSGVGAAVGSGAFASVDADRQVSVEVINDIEAYLRINELRTENEDGVVLGRSTQPGKVTKFQFPGTFEDRDDLTRGDGLGTDSEYYFDSLVEVGNQGTHPIVVFSEHSGEISKISIYDSDDPDRTLLTSENSGQQLDEGETFDAGIHINTAGMETGKSAKGTLVLTGIENSH